MNNIKITLHNYEYIKEKYLEDNTDEIEKYNNVLTSMKKGYSYFVLIVYGRSIKSSFDKADSVVELFRGLINLIDNAGSIPMQFGRSQGNPYSKYGPSRNILVFNADNKLIN